ncbi:hypothetical protein [Rufibacter immobilis]|uniref:hypothetical protein n=1 Tax=Rufibacter immobilis TaxID=1348778 RepID=UPI0011CE7579|nr:hypothetical protein [Rufibacter immobilis]
MTQLVGSRVVEDFRWSFFGEESEESITAREYLTELKIVMLSVKEPYTIKFSDVEQIEKGEHCAVFPNIVGEHLVNALNAYLAKEYENFFQALANFKHFNLTNPVELKFYQERHQDIIDRILMLRSFRQDLSSLLSFCDDYNEVKINQPETTGYKY